MQHKILFQPSEALIHIGLAENEEVQAEAGAMVFMSWNIEIETSTKGGFMGALKKSVLGGESFFTNKFVARKGPGEIGFCAPFAGDIKHFQLQNQNMYIQSGSYVCSSVTVNLDTQWAGAKGFFGGAGLFMLKASGSGDIFVNSFGAIFERDLNNDRFICDTGHIVAFTDGLSYNVKKVGGLKSTLFSGEGLVAEFNGTGKLWIQTRNPGSFISWLASKLPSK
ncbi:MAG: TIGR00266 family protein [Ignavibacteria bacterium]|nr:TIGR00266 family protein [Ignavibacteria bacterium]